MNCLSSPLRRCTTRLALLACALVALTRGLHAQTNWEGENIYQIVTDRFFNGDFANDNASGNYNPAAGQGVHGGDFKGIEQKLDYIKALGATAIWISPVVENGNGDYHGYAARDFYKTAPQMGTLAELKQLVDAAHAKGLRVINDIVVNHGAYDFLRSDDAGYPNFKAPPGGYGLRYRDNAKQYAPPFHPGSGLSLTSMFHNNGFTQDFNISQQVERGSLQGLDDFNTEHPYVREQMANIYKFWIDQVGFDGFRIDTVKHVDHGFWQSWSPQIRQHAASKGKPNFFMFGEVYDGSDAKVGSYTGTRAGGAFELDSVLDYPLYFSINGVFAHANAATKHIEDHYHGVDAHYDPVARKQVVTFLDNHDQARFLNSANANGNVQRLKLALAFLYTARGVPCLYYGTEQGFDGGADPNNREDMFAGRFEQGPSEGDNFNQTHPLFQFVAMLNNFRRLYPALTSGTHVNLWNNANGPGLFAYSRRLAAQEVFVVFNTATIAQTLPSRPSSYPSGTLLVNLLDPNDVITITPDGQTPSLVLPASSARLYIAQAEMQPLAPVVTSITPAHDKAGVPTPSKIVVTFSKAMDQASVEAAFSTTAAVSGEFTWSDADDQLTYQPAGGLPELRTLAVRVADTARAKDGTRMHAPFESRFATAAKTVQDTTPPTLTISSPAPGSHVSGWGGANGWASDDVSVARVEGRVDGGRWQIAPSGSGPSPTSWYYNYMSEFDVNGTHVISFRAIDAAGNVSAVSSVSVTFANVPPAYERGVYPYTGGGYGFTDCADGYHYGWDWAYGQYGEYGYIGGTAHRSDNAITNVCRSDQYLYQSERYGSPTEGFRYAFRCPPGVYEVTLLNAETFMSGPNQRRFDVYAQGEKMLSNFDIFREAGGANLGIRRKFNVTVSNNLLDVQLKPVFESPRLSAIHVKKIGEAVSDPDGVPDWWRLMYFGHVNALAEDQSRAEADPDGDGQTNLEESRAGTDPHDAKARFAISDVRLLGDYVYVQFHQVRNRTYQLQRTDSLTSPTWQDVGSPQLASSTGQTSVYDFGGRAVPNPKFYRVIMLP